MSAARGVALYTLLRGGRLEEFRARLEATPPLDPEPLGLLLDPRGDALQAEPPDVVAGRLSAWWLRLDALQPIAPSIFAAFLRALALLALGPQRCGEAPSAVREDAALEIIIRSKPSLFFLYLRGHLRDLADHALKGTVYDAGLGRPHPRSLDGHPFYLAATVGCVKAMELAAEWCHPSARAFRFALAVAFEANLDWSSTLDRRPLIIWLLSRVDRLRAVDLLALDRYHLPLMEDDLVPALFGCRALTPGSARSILRELAPWSGPEFAWSRPLLEEVLRRELRAAWLAAVAAAASLRPRA